MALIYLQCLGACGRGDPTPDQSTGTNQNQHVIICFLSPALGPWARGLSQCLSMREVLHWMQHQGAGPDPLVNSADEVKQKAQRGSLALRGLRGGMLLTLQTKPARQQSSPILSLIRKKDSLGAPSPTRRSICAQAELNWYIFPHYSKKAYAARPSSKAAVRGEERDWEALRLRAECLPCPPLLPLIWLGLQSSIHKPCLEPPNACVWTRRTCSALYQAAWCLYWCLIIFNGTRIIYAEQIKDFFYLFFGSRMSIGLTNKCKFYD